MKSYTELDVWIIARQLVKDVYLISKQFPKEETYGLTNQIRRCAVSIPSNIAEGCGRNTAKDTLQFLFIARGSTYELETQLYVAMDLDYLNQETLESILAKVTDAKWLINGFINYYQKLHTSPN